MTKVSFTIFTLFLGTAVLVSVPLTAGAQSTLVNIGVDPNADFSGYLNTLYAIAIAVAALLAVLKIVIAGVKYMTSDIVTNKADAKRDIQGAIFGLLIVMSAMLILTIINPALTGGSIGGNISQLQAANAAPAAGGATPVAATPVVGTHYTSIPASDPGRATFQSDCINPPTNGIFGTHMGRARCYTSAPAGTTNVQVYNYVCVGFNPMTGCTSINTTPAEDSCTSAGGTFVPDSTPPPSGGSPGLAGNLICYIP